MIEQILVENNFSDKESQVYLCILEAGEIPVSRVAAKTHLKRSTVYGLIDALKARGFVFVTKRRGIQYISALSPRILVDRFKRSAEMAEKILPELIEMAYSSPLKPRVRFFEGLNEIKHVLREFSYSKAPSMGFTDYEHMPKELFKFIREEVIPERRRQKNRTRLIATDNSTNREIQKEDVKHYSEHRIVSFVEQNSPIELLLFGESHMAFLSFVKGEIFGVIIDSPAIYSTLKNIFEFVWGISKKDLD
ncbi:MAG: helix-turn-helix domain-containing protein [Candidatus Peregrinibacteria bacterium]|nr:helix-turn-helix domain-containing protein [Candidatus Peregrinibacteria bacterium]